MLIDERGNDALMVLESEDVLLFHIVSHRFLTLVNQPQKDQYDGLLQSKFKNSIPNNRNYFTLPPTRQNSIGVQAL